MQNKKVMVSIGMLAILAVIALATVGVWAVDGGDEIEEPAYEEIVALSAVEPMMNYQGRLLDSSGNPVNGNVNLIFRLYDIPTGGIELWSESKTVQVVNGLLNTDLKWKARRYRRDSNCWAHLTHSVWCRAREWMVVLMYPH